MNGEGAFLVEDFLDAVSAQLDRTQDALAAKAKVRPLMFALRNFAVDLQVFVSMDGDGNVRLRGASPGETGASTLKLEFTTITRPMVEENTVSLAMTQAPSLSEVGLKPDEERQLARLGVRTVAQLQELRASGAGVDGIARLTEGLVPADRLRAALALGRPQLMHVGQAPLAVPPPPAVPPHPSIPQPPASEGPGTPPPEPPVQPAEPVQPSDPTPIVHVAPGLQRLHLFGRNLLGTGNPPQVRLDGRPLEAVEMADDRLEVKLPPHVNSGALEVDLGDGETQRYRLEVGHAGNGAAAASTWSVPEEGE
jgi:hypothetical protein